MRAGFSSYFSAENQFIYMCAFCPLLINGAIVFVCLCWLSAFHLWQDLFGFLLPIHINLADLRCILANECLVEILSHN